METNDKPQNDDDFNKMDKPTPVNVNDDPKLLPATKKQRSAKQLEAFKKMREAKIKSLELKKKLQSTKNRTSVISEEYEEDSDYKSSDNNGGGMNNPPAVAVSRPRVVPNPKPQPQPKPKPQPRRIKSEPQPVEEYYEDDNNAMNINQPQNIIYNYQPKPLPQTQKINYYNNPYGLNTITYNPNYIQKHVNTEQNSRRMRRQIPNIPYNPNAYY